MFSNLYAEMARCGITQKNISEAISVTQKTASNKILGKTEFTLREMRAIKAMFPNSSNITFDYLFSEDPTSKTTEPDLAS